jgi:ribosomal protein L34E
MSQKCVKCGVPLEGFMAKIAGFMGVKKSEKNPDCCNKCESSIGGESAAMSDSTNTSAENHEDHSGHDRTGGSCCH